MKRFKDLTFVLALLEQVAGEPTLDPDQRGALLDARRKLQRLRRSGNVPHPELYRVIRVVAEALWNAAADDDQRAEQ